MKIELEKIDKKINDEELEKFLNYVLEVSTNAINKLDEIGKKMEETSESISISIKMLRSIKEDCNGMS